MKKKPDNTAKANEPKPPKKTEQTIKGPEPERLKIEGDWVKAIDHSLTMKRPPTGWPK